MDAVFGCLREPAQVEQVAGVVAVNQVYRQAQRDDRLQGRRRHQITAVQHNLRAERFRLGDPPQQAARGGRDCRKRYRFSEHASPSILSDAVQVFFYSAIIFFLH
jgi:hypothetical protein